MKEKVLSLLEEIENLKNKDLAECRMPGNSFFLNDTDILCMDREVGESRYPYFIDGLKVWAHSSGHINISDGTLTIFREASQLQQESNLDFWGGIKCGEYWFPISITGVSRQLFEPDDIKRYLVYTRKAAYYIAETDKLIFSLRINVSSDMFVNFTLCAINKTNEKVETYLSSYFEPQLRYTNNDNEWAPLKRYGKSYENGAFKIRRDSNPDDNDPVNYAVFNKMIFSKNTCVIESTVSKETFMGGRGRVFVNAQSLKNGKFSKNVTGVNNCDMAVAADIIKFVIDSKDAVTVNYTMDIAHSEKDADALLGKKVNLDLIKKDFLEQEKEELERLGGFDISFGKLKGIDLNNVLLNSFIKSVQKQVDYNTSSIKGTIGFRDIFQQITATIMWGKDLAKEMIPLSLNYVFSTGRLPRQFSISSSDDIKPSFNKREYIDQAFWIIETVHKYISLTGDFSVLDEKCSYYEIVDEDNNVFEKSEEETTVLEHLLRLTDYLVSKIDDRTNCLRILFGDWNDQLSGLGETRDGRPGFGTGVSVMATEQFHKHLKEVNEILKYVGGYDEKCKYYDETRTKLAEGLVKYAVQKDGDRRHIVHGWGDKGEYYIGSLCDTDGIKRFSSTSYSFWCIGDIIKHDPSMKADILKGYEALDSKFGFKTFDKPFSPATDGVGRIRLFTPGTAENACTYVHAVSFAIMALFIIGEPEKAWEQIMKILPITHKELSKTTFVMSNSYCSNEEYGLDGESMVDWGTGSGPVLLRGLFEYALGIQATIDGVKFATPYYIPCDDASVEFELKGKKVKYVYKNTNSGSRKYFVDGVEMDTETDSVSGYKVMFIKNDDVKENMLIEVID